MNLQDAFLNQLRIAKTPVTVYLIGGQQLKGIVKGFDSFSILLELAGKDNLVYKHAISTISQQDGSALRRERKTENQEGADE